MKNKKSFICCNDQTNCIVFWFAICTIFQRIFKKIETLSKGGFPLIFLQVVSDQMQENH